MSIDRVRAALSPGRRAGVLLAAGALLPIPLLAGCSSDGDSPSSSGAPAAQDVATAARGSVRDGGTLRWAVDTMPGTFNTFQADAGATSDRIAGAVLPALFTVDAHGRPQANPDYLRSAAVVSREPRQVVVYKLNPKAKWSDGRTLRALDFAAQWKALNGRNTAYWTARNAGYDRIEKVEQGADQHQVKVTFRKPYADWQALFTPLYPRSVTGSPRAFNDGARRSLKATAGPFVIKERDADRNTVTLARNPRWWGDRAKLDRIVLDAVPRGQRRDALEAGALDLADVDRATATRIDRAAGARQAKGKQDGDAREDRAARTSASSDDRPRSTGKRALSGYVLRKSLEPAYTQLAMNGETGPLADERVRRAVARALDRQKIANAVLKPLGLPARPLGSHLRMAGQQGYEDHSSAVGGKDTAAAQALLADAGWRSATGAERDQTAAEGGSKAKGARNGAPLAKKDGKALSLRFVLPSGAGTESLDMVGRRISGMLDAVGIRTEIVKVPDAATSRTTSRPAATTWPSSPGPATAFPATDGRPIFAKPRPRQRRLPGRRAELHPGRHRPDRPALREGEHRAGRRPARALVSRADARIWAAAGSIPLYQRPSWWRRSRASRTPAPSGSRPRATRTSASAADRAALRGRRCARCPRPDRPRAPCVRGRRGPGPGAPVARSARTMGGGRGVMRPPGGRAYRTGRAAIHDSGRSAASHAHAPRHPQRRHRRPRRPRQDDPRRRHAQAGGRVRRAPATWTTG